MTRDEVAARRYQRLRGKITARLERGDALERIERELIAPSRLTEEHRSALWLYAWSLSR